MEDVETKWANYCPECGYIEDRPYGPGRFASSKKCPDCSWPFNVVDPVVFIERRN